MWQDDCILAFYNEKLLFLTKILFAFKKNYGSALVISLLTLNNLQTSCNYIKI